MILVQEQPKVKHRIMKIDALSLGQMFLLNLNSDVYMKVATKALNDEGTELIKTTLKGFNGSVDRVEEKDYQAAIRLKDGELFIFEKYGEVYLVDGTLKWEVIMDD